MSAEQLRLSISKENRIFFLHLPVTVTTWRFNNGKTRIHWLDGRTTRKITPSDHSPGHATVERYLRSHRARRRPCIKESEREIMLTTCCGKSQLRQLHVGEGVLNLSGIQDILEHFYLEGWSPDEPTLGEALVEALREAGNHIPRGCEGESGRVLRKMFSEYCQ